jgi:hypothetical protein
MAGSVPLTPFPPPGEMRRLMLPSLIFLVVPEAHAQSSWRTSINMDSIWKTARSYRDMARDYVNKMEVPTM